MVSKKLSAVWALFALALLAAAGLTIALSVIWQMPNPLFHFVVDDGFLKVGLALGVIYAITFVVAVAAIVQPNHVTLGLSILNWILLFDAITTVVIGSVISFFTLKEMSIYWTKFDASTPQVQQLIQDQFKCCGYMATTLTTTFAGFCADPTLVSQQQPCMVPLLAYADFTLNNIFTSIYGFMAVIIGLFLASICVINKRVEAERFRKIDAKRGGKGFV